MVDNVIVSQNVGVGATVATDDIGGIQHQRVKVVIGADGVSNGDVSASNPMPTVLRDSSGTEIGTETSPLHIAGSNVVLATNTTTAILGIGATFTGTGEFVEDAAQIEVFCSSDVDSANAGMQIQFSVDNISWTAESLITKYKVGIGVNLGQSWLTAAKGKYVRIVYTNGAVAQTVFSLTTIARAIPMSGDILDTVGEMPTNAHAQVVRSIVTDPFTGYNKKVDRFGQSTSTQLNRLLGTTFDGTTKDANFWTETVSAGATATQAQGEVLLKTLTTANAWIQYQTAQRSRWVSGTDNVWRGIFALTTAGTANNLRRFGAFNTVLATSDPEDGVWFQIDGSTVGIGYRSLSQDAVPNVVTMANWSTGRTVTLGTGIHSFNIVYAYEGIEWYVDNVLVHAQVAGADTLVDSMHLKSTFQNINSGGSTSPVSLMAHVAGIFRIGEYSTAPITKYITGAATTILKYGPGVIHSIINGDKTTNLTILIYDGITAVNQIGYIDGALILGSSGWDLAPFFTGLTIVTSHAGAKITVVYE